MMSHVESPLHGEYVSIGERPWGTVELVNIMHHGYPHRYLERMTKKPSEGLLWDQQILASFFGALFFKTWFCIIWFWPWMCWCVFFQPYFLFVQVSSQATCALLFHLFLVDPNFTLAWQAWHRNYYRLGCILRDLRGRFQKLLPPEFAHYSDRDFMHAVAWQLMVGFWLEGVNPQRCWKWYEMMGWKGLHLIGAGISLMVPTKSKTKEAQNRQIPEQFTCSCHSHDSQLYTIYCIWIWWICV